MSKKNHCYEIFRLESDQSQVIEAETMKYIQSQVEQITSPEKMIQTLSVENAQLIQKNKQLAAEQDKFKLTPLVDKLQQAVRTSQTQAWSRWQKAVHESSQAKLENENKQLQENFQKERDVLTRKREQAQMRSEELRDIVGQKESKIAKQQTQLDIQEKKLQEQNDQINKQTELTQKQRQEIEQANQGNVDLQSQLQDSKQDNAELQKGLDNASSVKLEIEQKLSGLQDNLAKLAQTISSTSTTISEDNRRPEHDSIEKITTQIHQLQQQREQLQGKLDVNQQQYQGASKLGLFLNKKVLQQENKVFNQFKEDKHRQGLDKQNKDFDNQSQALQSQLEQLNVKVEEANYKAKVVEKEKTDLEKISKGLNKLTNTHPLSGVFHKLKDNVKDRKHKEELDKQKVAQRITEVTSTKLRNVFSRFNTQAQLIAKDDYKQALETQKQQAEQEVKHLQQQFNNAKQTFASGAEAAQRQIVDKEAEFQKKIGHLESKLAELTTQTAQAKEQQQLIQKKIEAKNKEDLDLTQKLQEAEKTLAQLNGCLNLKNNELEALQSTKQELTSELAKQTELTQKQQRDIEQKTNKADELEQTQKTLQEQVEHQKQQTSERENKIKQQEKELQSYADKNSQLESKNSTLKSARKEVKKNNTELTEQNLALKLQLDQQKQQVKVAYQVTASNYVQKHTAKVQHNLSLRLQKSFYQWASATKEGKYQRVLETQKKQLGVIYNLESILNKKALQQRKRVFTQWQDNVKGNKHQQALDAQEEQFNEVNKKHTQKLDSVKTDLVNLQNETKEDRTKQEATDQSLEQEKNKNQGLSKETHDLVTQLRETQCQLAAKNFLSSIYSKALQLKEPVGSMEREDQKGVKHQQGRSKVPIGSGSHVEGVSDPSTSYECDSGSFTSLCQALKNNGFDKIDSQESHQKWKFTSSQDPSCTFTITKRANLFEYHYTSKKNESNYDAQDRFFGLISLVRDFYRLEENLKPTLQCDFALDEKVAKMSKYEGCVCKYQSINSQRASCEPLMPVKDIRHQQLYKETMPQIAT